MEGEIELEKLKKILIKYKELKKMGDPEFEMNLPSSDLDEINIIKIKEDVLRIYNEIVDLFVNNKSI